MEEEINKEIELLVDGQPIAKVNRVYRTSITYESDSEEWKGIKKLVDEQRHERERLQERLDAEMTESAVRTAQEMMLALAGLLWHFEAGGLDITASGPDNKEYDISITVTPRHNG